MLRRSLGLFLVLSLLAPWPAWATDYDAANEDVWPSQNDVAQTAGNGKKLLENQWGLFTTGFAQNNYTLSNLLLPGSSASLSINVPAGHAYLAGRWVSIPGSTSVTATANLTNYVFLKLTRDGANLVTGVAFEVNTSGTAPADSTPIGTLVAGASTITSTVDTRITGPGYAQVVSTGIFVYPAGITRIYVEVFGASGGGGGGGEAYDVSGPTSGGNGSDGGAGGTTSFSSFSASGGAGGKGGIGGGNTTAGSAGAAHGAGSGATVNFTGQGLPGGLPGLGGQAGNVAPGLNGGAGGNGGYAAGWLSGSPGDSPAVVIGAAGTAGSGGSGNSAQDGGAGQTGLAGRIVIHY